MSSVPDDASPHRRGRVHRRFTAWAGSVEPYRKLLEFTLLAAGFVYAAVFVFRTWQYPAAAFSVEVPERTPGSANMENVVVRASFAVAGPANLTVKRLSADCVSLANGKSCWGTCGSIGEQLSAGTLSRDDARSWGCLFLVPSHECAQVTERIDGRAFGFAWTDSHWLASTITCGSKK